MNPSTHEILLAFYWLFIVIPGAGIFLAGLKEFFEILTTPPPKPLPPPVVYREEKKREKAWCYVCCAKTDQDFVRWNPYGRFTVTCRQCYMPPDMGFVP